MNRKEIRQVVRKLLVEPDAENSFWTNEELNAHIQAAYDQLVTEAELMHCTSTTPSLAGQADYQMPGDVLLVLRVWYDGQPLRKTSPQDLDLLDRLWMTRQCEPGQVPTYWMPRGQMIRLYPAPAESGKEIQTWGVQSPRPLVQDDQIPEIPQGWHMPIAWLAAYFAANGDYTNQSLRAASQAWLGLYQRALAKASQVTLRREVPTWRLRDVRELVG